MSLHEDDAEFADGNCNRLLFPRAVCAWVVGFVLGKLSMTHYALACELGLGENDVLRVAAGKQALSAEHLSAMARMVRLPLPNLISEATRQMQPEVWQERMSSNLGREITRVLRRRLSVHDEEIAFAENLAGTAQILESFLAPDGFADESRMLANRLLRLCEEAKTSLASTGELVFELTCIAKDRLTRPGQSGMQGGLI